MWCSFRIGLISPFGRRLSAVVGHILPPPPRPHPAMPCPHTPSCALARASKPRPAQTRSGRQPTSPSHFDIMRSKILSQGITVDFTPYPTEDGSMEPIPAKLLQAPATEDTPWPPWPRQHVGPIEAKTKSIHAGRQSSTTTWHDASDTIRPCHGRSRTRQRPY